MLPPAPDPPHNLDDRNVPLSLVLGAQVGEEVLYVYDLGDNWEHVLTVEEVREGAAVGTVLLIDGFGPCPPEDSNGLEGKGSSSYKAFMDTYEKKPLNCKQSVKEIERSAMNYKATGSPACR